MHSNSRPQGPWTHHYLISVATLVVGLLFYWLLGSVLADIGSISGPVRSDVERALVDNDLLDREGQLNQEIAETQRSIADSSRRQAVLRDSADNSETTMNRLLEIQKLNLQRGVAPQEVEQAALGESERLFLETQRQYQAVNDRIAELTDQLRLLETKQQELRHSLTAARIPFQREYDRLMHRHQMRLGFLKFALLVPLLATATLLAFKYRSRLYVPLCYAAGSAVGIKVLWVMHQHFPRRFFKYILLLTALSLAITTLVCFLRRMAFPKRSWLLRPYREAYERFLCPICAFPIRRGPLRFAFWTRRRARKLTISAGSANEPEEPYVCPICATRLYEKCPSCQTMRAA